MRMLLQVGTELAATLHRCYAPGPTIHAVPVALLLSPTIRGRDAWLRVMLPRHRMSGSRSAVF
jgi:hypothetical protein